MFAFHADNQPLQPGAWADATAAEVTRLPGSVVLLHLRPSPAPIATPTAAAWSLHPPPFT